MRRVVEHYAHEAADSIVRSLAMGSWKYISLAIERVEDLGVSVYGDKSYHLTVPELRNEMKPEVADAIVYRSIEMWVEDGRPDVWTIDRG